MRTRTGAAAFAAALCFSTSALGQAGGGYDISWSTIDCGAGTATFGGVYEIAGIVGQPDASHTDEDFTELLGGQFGSDCIGETAAYGVGCPGTGGLVPTYSVTGCPDAGRKLTFSMANALPGTQAILFLGLSPLSAPIGGGCTLLAGTLLPTFHLPIPIGPDGTLTFALPVAPGGSGVLVFSQMFFVDSGNPLGINASNGVAIQLG